MVNSSTGGAESAPEHCRMMSAEGDARQQANQETTPAAQGPLLQRQAVPGQARELRPAVQATWQPSATYQQAGPREAFLPGPVVSAAHMMQSRWMAEELLRRRVLAMAVFIAAYLFGTSMFSVLFCATAAEMVKYKLEHLVVAQHDAQLAYLVNLLPAIALTYTSPIVVVMGLSGFLFALCGCCAVKANRSACACCFCCCNAWHACLSCVSLLGSLALVVLISGTASHCQVYLERCDPTACMFHGAEPGENHRRTIDCLAQAQWGSSYKAKDESNARLSHMCSDFNFLTCKGDGVYCSDSTYEEWNGTYRMSLSGTHCPCGSTYILDWEECNTAMRSCPKWKGHTRLAEPLPASGAQSSGCYAQESDGFEFRFDASFCSTRMWRSYMVCKSETSDRLSRGERKKAEKCDARPLDVVLPSEPPFEYVPQPEDPVASCTVNDDFIEIFELAKAESGGFFRRVQIMNLLGMGFIIAGTLLFGLGFWYGQMLWSKMQTPLQQSYMQQGMPHAMFPFRGRNNELQMVQQPLMLSSAAAPPPPNQQPEATPGASPQGGA